MRLSDAEWCALIYAAHTANVLDGAFAAPGGQHPRAVFRKLEAKGLVTEEWAAKVDGDGWLITPERWGTCFKLTEPGRRLAALLKDADRALSDGRMVAKEKPCLQPAKDNREGSGT